jgi:hypothetical protein
MMYTIVVDVGIQTKRNQHISIEQPRHVSSTSASISHTLSAVIGRFPREITKPFRFVVRRDLFAAPAAAPVNERRNSRFTATLMLQSSALARDFASAYRSLSRFAVSLMTFIGVCSGAVVSTGAETVGE